MNERTETPLGRLARLAIFATGLWILTGALFKLLLGTPADLPQPVKDVGLPLGTTYRLAKTLVMLGYLLPAEGKRYRLGLKVLDLGFNAFGQMDLNTIARPILRSLMGPINEAASIAVLDGPELVYVERLQMPLGRLGTPDEVAAAVSFLVSAGGAYVTGTQLHVNGGMFMD